MAVEVTDVAGIPFLTVTTKGQRVAFNVTRLNLIVRMGDEVIIDGAALDNSGSTGSVHITDPDEVAWLTKTFDLEGEH